MTLYMDPFGGKTTAYYFTVYASGRFNDGMVLDDGRSTDDSWDGVWYRAVNIHDDCYGVEIRIPFRSIRYKRGLTEWGINFERYILNNRETVYWTEVLQIEDNMVSKYGRLKGINPQSTGYYFELYPEGFVRYDKERKEEGKIKPSGSLNFKWDLTSQTTLDATVLPDFAQIESDPFTLNLSEYEEWLDERRPFFLEGKDIFRMSDLGKGFYHPLNIFYSRGVGKSIDGESVPILGGLKLTSKAESWNFGAFGANTDSLRYLEDDTVLTTEPRRSFGVLRVKRRVLETSEVGMLFSGMRADKDDYNFAFGLDGVYRSGINQFILQGALSDKNNKKGWAISSVYFGFIRNFLAVGSVEVVQDSFDVEDVGYLPWAGMKKILSFVGPFKMYPTGALRNLSWGPGVALTREPGDVNGWSKVGFLFVNPCFRNNWGFNLQLQAGPCCEEDTEYFNRGINLSVWGNGANYHVSFGGNFNHSYNYDREFVAYQGSNWLWCAYNEIPRTRLSLSLNNWVEWDTLNTIIAITTNATPRIDFSITEDMNLGIFNEFVMEIPQTYFGETELTSNRAGLLFSWNFLPKSWLYIALNDHREQNDERKLELQNQVGAIKAKYLLYF